jgi:phosphoribosylanthranilate isomerase
MMVKVCGITNRDDALAAAESGASAIGLNFYPKSPRYVTLQHAEDIIRALPNNVLKVGVFVNETRSTLRFTAKRIGLDVIQLHGDETPDNLPPGCRVWKAFRVTEEFRPRELDAYTAEAFVLDGPAEAYGGGGKPFDWAAAAGVSHKIIVAGGLDAANVASAIRVARPWGVDACSRLEIAPGRKDHAKLRAFLKAALETSLEA